MSILTEHGATILISLILAAAVILVIRKMARDKKAGKGGCCGECRSCPHSGGFGNISEK